MKIWLSLLLAAAMLFFGACSDGGAPSDSDTAYHGPLGDEGYTDEPTPVVVDGFTKSYRYVDGVVITPQVTAGKVDQKVQDHENKYYADEDLPDIGAGYVNVLVVIKNESNKPFDALQLGTTFTYGPDAIEPQGTLEYKSRITAFNTKILAGRSRTGGQTYLVPEKYWDDAALEISRDGYPTLIYTGQMG